MIIDNDMAAINSEIQTRARDFGESVVAEIDPVQKMLNGIRDDPWKDKVGEYLFSVVGGWYQAFVLTYCHSRIAAPCRKSMASDFTSRDARRVEWTSLCQPTGVQVR